jgi:hypothetical protein
MRNEITCAVNHIGIAGFPRFDARDNIPNVLEIYLGPKHANHRAGELLNRKSDRHIRLGVFHEVDRAVVGRSLQSPLKATRGIDN